MVAPGFYTYSAKASGSSEQTCEILDMAGTSMATPCVSGNAGIIRQYFVNYNSSANNGCTYTHGTSNLQLTSGFCDANTNPRGATVKAMLIHSGQPMFAYETSNYKTEEPRAVLSSPPDMYQVITCLESFSRNLRVLVAYLYKTFCRILELKTSSKFM